MEKRSLSCRESEADFQGEKCLSRLGGTLNGIRENLDYLQDMGFNCLYLNPIFAASSYHKYDTLDYFRIDPTRGTEADFRALVKEAHRLGLRVLIDGVFNHIGWRHPFFQDVLKRGKASPYWSWFYDLPERPRYPDAGEMPEYACFSYVPQMPKTNTSCPEMREYFCRVGAYWVREFDVDGCGWTWPTKWTTAFSGPSGRPSNGKSRTRWSSARCGKCGAFCESRTDGRGHELRLPPLLPPVFCRRLHRRGGIRAAAQQLG